MGYTALRMSTVTLTRTTYLDLKRRAAAYERIVTMLERDVFTPPPVRNVRKIMVAFRRSNRYPARFLKSLERGLSRSTYFEK